MFASSLTPHHLSGFTWGRILWVLCLSMLVMGPVGCKSKKKLAEEQAQAEAGARAKQIESLKADVQSLMADPVRDMEDLESREQRLADIRALGLDDAGLNTLIRKAEYFLQQERERLNREMAPDPEPVDNQAELKRQLNRSFQQIAQAVTQSDADRAINSTLGLFASGEIPVLIVISQAGGLKDYDRPTTIERYLQYLKDQRRAPDQVANVVLNDAGLITELELVKAY